MKKNIFILFLSLFFVVFLQAQERAKDSLFFKYDNKYIKTYAEIPKQYYLDNSKSGGSGTFFLNEVQIVKNLKKMKKMLCLKEFVHDPKFYNKKQMLDDNKLAEYLSKHVVYLVRKNEYIQVQAGHEID